MATVRLATTEVQVDEIIYTFDSADRADAFEACVATVDLSHCEADHAPIGRRPAGEVGTVAFAPEAAAGDDGSVLFNALVDSKPVQCQISRAALETYFGAHDTTHAIDVFTQSRDKIQAIAERKLRDTPHQRVQIDLTDLG